MENFKKLPVIALRSMTILPDTMIHFDLIRKKSILAAEQAMSEDQEVFLVTQCHAETEDPQAEDLYQIGCIAKVKQVTKLPDNLVRVLVEGVCRGRLRTLFGEWEWLGGDIEVLEVPAMDESRKEAMLRSARDRFTEYCKYYPRTGRTLLRHMEEIHDPGKLMDQIIEENRQKRTAMLHALQAQINPHFLYNALDMVSWHALSKGEDSIADIVSSISNLMHYSISRPDSTASLSREIENIREFIRIYQMERPCDIQLIPDFSPEQADQIPIPKFTLQPLVENSILHNANLDHLTIRIQIHRQPDCTEISVTDDGIGADPEQLNAFLRYENTSLTVSSGFGIRNVNERLQLHFGNNSHLSYQKDSDGHLTASLFLMSAPLS